MITYNSINCIPGLSFEQYLQLPGYSFSTLKTMKDGVAEEVVGTWKMRLGSIVDAILSEQPIKGMMNDELYPAAKKIAFRILQQWGDEIRFFKKQQSYTGVATFNGFGLPVRGRPDYELPKFAVIDLKITHEKDMRGVIKHFNYEDQLFNYAKLANVPHGFILMYSTKLGIADMFYADCRRTISSFWQSKIMDYGNVAA